MASESVQPVTGTLSGGNGNRLFYRRWAAPGAGKVLLIVHGLGEHSARYVHVGGFFQAHGYDVLAFDLRGHGRSEGRRGWVARYGDLAADLEAVFQQVDMQRTVVFAHSFGAQLALWFLAQSRQRPQGLVASAPWLALSEPPGPNLVRFARFLNRWWPAFGFPTGITGTKVSGDQAFLDSFEDKHLGIPIVRVRTYFEAERAAAELRDRPQCPVPVLVAHGSEDPVTSLAETLKFFERLEAPVKELRIYPGFRHELHNETGRDVVLQDYLEWIEGRLNPGEA
jgi:acylglycerol lipase